MMKKKNLIMCMVTLLFLSLLVLVGATVSSKAASTYKIKVNKSQCTVTIYKYKSGGYKAIKAMVCSPGYATPTGTFSLGEKLRWHTLDGPSYGQYCSRITGSILFHSVWYYEMNKKTQSYVQYNKLGTLASHGCVRLTVADAKWIYDKIPSGTPIKIYSAKKAGPLGKPSAIKVRGYQGWDPTDPDASNPYKKKNPKIKGVKSRTLLYKSKFKVKSGITATNSTGFDATKLVKTEIYYRLDSGSSYVKVKKVDTSTPGKYKVKYKVKDEIGHKTVKTAIYTVPIPVQVKKITLKTTKKTLYLGGAASKSKFTLKVKSIKPDKASDKSVVYQTAAKKIVTVSQKGVVKAKGAGKAYITVRAHDGSGVYAQCLMTIKQLAKRVAVNAPAKKLSVGTSMQLKTTVTPADTTNKKVSYTSSDKSIATVTANGSVKGISPGTVTITATAKDGSGKKGTIKINVYREYEKTDDEYDEYTVGLGTTWEAVKKLLRTDVPVADKTGYTDTALVTWSKDYYDAGKPGTYHMLGQITLPAKWEGSPDPLARTIWVTGYVASGSAVVSGATVYLGEDTDDRASSGGAVSVSGQAVEPS